LLHLTGSTSWCLVRGLEDCSIPRFTELLERPDLANSLWSVDREHECMSGLWQWSSAFEPLLLDSQNHGNNRDYAATISLNVRNMAYRLAVAGGFHGEMYYDRELRTIQEILSLSEILMSCITSSGLVNRTILGFERIVARSIYIVARMCRDRATRRKAIFMLESGPRLEGSWDSHVLAKVATINMKLRRKWRKVSSCQNMQGSRLSRLCSICRNGKGHFCIPGQSQNRDQEHVTDEVLFTW
jgi:hypothetical protein